jgi:hypothetical protein
MREVRLDFLIKLYFLLDQDPARARDLIETQIEICNEYEASVDEERSAVEPGSFDAMVLESKASAGRITREWLEQALGSLLAVSGKE